MTLKIILIPYTMLFTTNNKIIVTIVYLKQYYFEPCVYIHFIELSTLIQQPHSKFYLPLCNKKVTLERHIQSRVTFKN
jgi:hypothetical protein